MENKQCANCAYHNKNVHGCVRTQTHVQDTDSCSYYTNSPTICAACGKYIIGSSFLEQVKEGQYVELCAQCAKAISTCAGCTNGIRCAFEEDPSPLPKIVPHTVRQGNSIIQTQIQNPERVRLLCEKCPCWDTEDKACNRECHNCSNYHSVLSS